MSKQKYFVYVHAKKDKYIIRRGHIHYSYIGYIYKAGKGMMKVKWKGDYAPIKYLDRALNKKVIILLHKCDTFNEAKNVVKLHKLLLE